MPGRFKKLGVFYISEWGGSSGNPGTAELPFATLANVTANNQNTVIGTGVYDGSSATAKKWFGDGLVIIRANPNLQTHTNYYENCYLKNGTGTQLIGTTFLDCILENFTNISSGSNCIIERCIIKDNFVITLGVNHAWSRVHNSIILCDLGGYTNFQFQGNYVAKNVKVMMNGFADSNGNCINGKIIQRSTGLLFEIKTYWDGTPRPDADPEVGDITSIDSTFLTTRQNFACREEEVGFIDVLNKIVSPDSKLLRNSYMGPFVGAVRPGKLISLDDNNFQVSFTRIDTSNPLSVRVASGQLDGEIRITGKISDSIVSSTFLGLRTILQYFKGAAGGSTENNNVPDGVKQLGLLASEIDKPRRLTYFMRTSLDPNANQSSPANIWDNDIGQAGTWYLMEVNTSPGLIGTGAGAFGNGDPRATGGVESPINFRSIDIRVVLDNARV